ncbi:hypothetical protein [Phaeobacter phage MD18]|nr:hypothetical protein [Phaeobacter phage MD18]
MKYLLVVLILGNNAEAVDQVGPFETEAACERVLRAVVAADDWTINPLDCFPTGGSN